MQWASFASHVRTDPAGTLLALDFDGTLAPIVDDPTLARIDERLATVLARLAPHVHLTIISGRPRAFLASQLAGIDATIVGNYGRGEAADPRLERRLDEVARQARAVLGPTIDLERKPTSIALHFRRHPEAAEEVARFCQAIVDDEAGWEVAPGRMVVEILTASAADKGTALAHAGVGRRAVGYAGDDLADVAAMKVLARLTVPTCGIAIASPELPEALRQIADEVLSRDEFALRLEELAADLNARSR